MELYLAFFITAFTSLFTIIGPISAIPVYLTIIKNSDKIESISIARKSSIFGASVLIIFAFIGTFILDFFGITISAFRIAGGILIARVGFQMIYEEDDNTNTSKKTKKKEKTTMLNKEALALVPLAVPMLSGAGAMNTTISLMNDAKNIFEHFYVILSIIFVFVITFYILINARYIEKILGEKGKSIFLKIMGLLTFIIGIQFIINGFTIMLSGWGLI